MKPLFYLASLLVFAGACRHQKAVAPTDANSNNTTTTHVTTQGEVQIKTDESTSATIIIDNSPDTVVTTVNSNNSNSMQDTAKDIYRLTISFFSKGEGIDWKTQETFVKWLDAHSSHPKYDVSHWGREGETNYCLKLTELSTREQEIFVRDVRTQLSNKELVSIEEYAKCKGTIVQH